ncbi:cytochrome c [Aureimonas sp. SA4125]|uniref:c-type cytochrome n=1 Tax=Aureimonas sp. SA4125 TaxID=2826993 RepID=UPI001CC6031C|nr:cytochrome c family protein [Aureimonas sp. SA4125]BDA86025.1 cytochrome c [Aureimonas sp. SA4125]
MRFSSTLLAGALVAAAFATPALAQSAGDPVAGKKVFNKCMACHAVGPNAKNKVGPELNGIIGEAVASVEGYNFSPALKEYAATNPTWDEANMTAWLANPKAVVPKTKMAFPGLKKPEEIANVIAYLKSFDETGAAAAN